MRRRFHLSKIHLPPFEKINELVEKHREQGIKLMFIFKTIKNAVINRIEDENPTEYFQFPEDDINRECMKISKDILDGCSENPSEEDIIRVLSSQKKLQDNV